MHEAQENTERHQTERHAHHELRLGVQVRVEEDVRLQEERAPEREERDGVRLLKAKNAIDLRRHNDRRDEAGHNDDPV